MMSELKVQDNTSVIYTIEPHIETLHCIIGAHAQLNVLHMQQPDTTKLRIICEQQTASSLLIHGWYPYSIDLHLEIRLQGNGARAEIKIGRKGVETSIMRMTSLQRHEAPGTMSRLICKTILTESAQTLHEGMIHITHEAENTQAALRSHHMLLSEKAHARVQPNLEVLTDRVQCAHASAIGTFDPEMLFYMQVRGLDITSATCLLEEAFFAEVR